MPSATNSHKTKDDVESMTAMFTSRSYPQHIKYMGSKARIAGFVVDGINRVHKSGPVCDLFAGACTLSGALGNQVDIVSNDIQHYSEVIAQSYLHRISRGALLLSADSICNEARDHVDARMKAATKILPYDSLRTLDEFNEIETIQRSLVNDTFDDEYHLFFKNYSGTWWSAEQCAWIDALRCVADRLLNVGAINSGDHALFLTCVMHAMAYTSQGTGHYAQYRDAKTEYSMSDIKIYRSKSVEDYFKRKFESLKKWNYENVPTGFSHKLTTLDFTDCLGQLEGGTVYADPPYAFVHYSRFYHAIETFVLYDYPKLQVKGGAVVKGRYREDRHQSPFCIRSEVAGAFHKMFEGVARAEANLVLSYSNTALLGLDDMIDIANSELSKKYRVCTLTTDHKHMTMGRLADRNRDVEETLVLAEII